MAKELLVDVSIRTAKPDSKDKRLNDGNGLYLLIKPNGAKWWRFDYSIKGKRKTLSLGVYPDTGLKQAREKLGSAKKQIADGIDPSDTRKEIKTVEKLARENERRLDAGLTIIDSFAYIAEEWGQKKVETWSDKNNRSKRMLERNIFPWLGSKPIAEILPKDIMACLRRVEDRGTIETAHRTLQICGQVFRYAVATGRVDRDITPDLRGTLPVAKGEHFAAITEPKQVAELLRAIDSYQGSFTALSALKFAPLVFVRPGELRAAEWQHFDLEAKEWRYFVSKTAVQHIVPLSSQAIAILQEIQPLTGHGRYVFPSERILLGVIDACLRTPSMQP